MDCFGSPTTKSLPCSGTIPSQVLGRSPSGTPSETSSASNMAISAWIGSVSWDSSMSRWEKRRRKWSRTSTWSRSMSRDQTSRSWNSARPSALLWSAYCRAKSRRPWRMKARECRRADATSWTTASCNSSSRSLRALHALTPVTGSVSQSACRPRVCFNGRARCKSRSGDTAPGTANRRSVACFPRTWLNSWSSSASLENPQSRSASGHRASTVETASPWVPVPAGKLAG